MGYGVSRIGWVVRDISIIRNWRITGGVVMPRPRCLHALALTGQVLVFSSLLLPRPMPTVLAATETATPSTRAEVTVQPLFATVLPAGALPVAPTTDFLLWQASIAPGVTAVFPPGHFACCPGPLLTHVVAGELLLRVEGPLRVSRASPVASPGAAEAVLPGTVVTLRPGDTALWRLELPMTYANPGTAPLQLVAGGFFGGYAPAPVAGYQVLDLVEQTPAPPLPPGAVTMELVRVDMPPGTELTAAPVGALRLALRESGAGLLKRRADGALANSGRTAVVVHVLTLFPHSGAGTLMPAP
jgi:hypothetical protein